MIAHIETAGLATTLLFPPPRLPEWGGGSQGRARAVELREAFLRLANFLASWSFCLPMATDEVATTGPAMQGAPTFCGSVWYARSPRRPGTAGGGQVRGRGRSPREGRGKEASTPAWGDDAASWPMAWSLIGVGFRLGAQGDLGSDVCY